jgi:hypothetical protein
VALTFLFLLIRRAVELMRIRRLTPTNGSTYESPLAATTPLHHPPGSQEAVGLCAGFRTVSVPVLVPASETGKETGTLMDANVRGPIIKPRPLTVLLRHGVNRVAQEESVTCRRPARDSLARIQERWQTVGDGAISVRPRRVSVAQAARSYS